MTHISLIQWAGQQDTVIGKKGTHISQIGMSFAGMRIASYPAAKLSAERNDSGAEVVLTATLRRQVSPIVTVENVTRIAGYTTCRHGQLNPVPCGPTTIVNGRGISKDLPQTVVDRLARVETAVEV